MNALKIKKIFNNNSILANDDNFEMVFIGCGIAFKKKIGDDVDKALIEKTFILKEKEARENFKLLLSHIPIEYITICYDIIEYAKSILEVELSDYIYVTLTDHINNALKLFKEGFHTPNMLIWEIKRFYTKEFEIGLKSLELIESETDVKLPEDEAANIAMHLINAQGNIKYGKLDDVVQTTKMITDILNIVKYTYSIELDNKSFEYERFITHLRFFFQRLKQKEKNRILQDDFLLTQVKNKYDKAYKCMLKVQAYLEIELSEEEQLYLTLHIQRVTQV